MKCQRLGYQKTDKLNWFTPYRCGKCLSCRINQQAAWILRNLLESQTARSKSFWTLTLSDAGLLALDSLGPRRLIRTFFDSLRQSESRAGNLNPIRYFGCLEYGGQFDRPHWHMLIYNLEANYQEAGKFTKGLPRPLFHTPLWPYGHIQSGTVTKASMRYVAAYMTEFKDQRNILFSTRRPAIGFYGLDRLAAILARKHSSLPLPNFLEISGSRYPLDAWTIGTLEERFKSHGIKVQKTTPFEKKLLALSTDLAAAEVLDPVQEIRNNDAKEIRHHVQAITATARKQKAIEALRAISPPEPSASQDSA